MSDFLWNDRKHIMGLPISFTKYSLDETRLLVHRGLLCTEEFQILLYRIHDIRVVQTLADRLFGVGTIIVMSNDTDTPELEICKVKAPREVKEVLHSYSMKARSEMRVRAGEMMT